MPIQVFAVKRLVYIDTRKYSVSNRAMALLTHWAGLRIGEVACLRWCDVVTSEGQIKDEIRLLPDMTKGRQARTVFINARLKAELQAYVWQARCVARHYPLFASQKAFARALVPIALRKPLPSFMRMRALRVPAATAGAARF